MIEVAHGTSGETSYLNIYDAFDTLPTELLARVEGRSATQDASYSSAGTLRPES